MSGAAFFEVPVVAGRLDFEITVPGSKSITNRALLLAALCDGPVVLRNVLFSDDSRHFLGCLEQLGFTVTVDEAGREVTVRGEGGMIPRREARLDVGSAGTAARFITAMVAAVPGRYRIDASPQMAKRPMKPLLDCLQSCGVRFSYPGRPEYLPLVLEGRRWPGGRILLRAEQSSQFLSALLLVGCLAAADLEIGLDGPLPAKPYIDMTVRMMADFGVTLENRNYQSFRVPAGQVYHRGEYMIEPDISNACYFWAMAALTGGSAMVKGALQDSLQGDLRFLQVLESLGCTVTETGSGIWVQGPAGGKYPGIEADMGGTPDQALTLAALAPFATSPTLIKNIAFIRFHETDRLQAILNELTRIGIRTEPTEDGLRIYPGQPRAATLETYDDHRMAMALSLIGLKTPGIRIANPACTAKTFENYFDLFEQITGKDKFS